jgi:hypothetical protein
LFWLHECSSEQTPHATLVKKITLLSTVTDASEAQPQARKIFCRKKKALEEPFLIFFFARRPSTAPFLSSLFTIRTMAAQHASVGPDSDADEPLEEEEEESESVAAVGAHATPSTLATAMSGVPGSAAVEDALDHSMAFNRNTSYGTQEGPELALLALRAANAKHARSSRLTTTSPSPPKRALPTLFSTAIDTLASLLANAQPSQASEEQLRDLQQVSAVAGFMWGDQSCFRRGVRHVPDFRFFFSVPHRTLNHAPFRRGFLSDTSASSEWAQMNCTLGAYPLPCFCFLFLLKTRCS